MTPARQEALITGPREPLFDRILGQNEAKDLLTRALLNQRLANTYIFYGPQGVGRRFTARLFACALNCEVEPNRGCGVCPSCHKVLTDQHPDVTFFYPEVQDIKIETVREIQRLMSMKLYEGRWRVFVLDQAEHLNPASANCLLKTLEEPPERSSLILICENPHGLLPTILSRSQMVAFHHIPALLMQKYLEGQGKTKEEAIELSQLCLGRMDRLETLMDPKKQKKIDDMIKLAQELPGLNLAKIVETGEKYAQAAKRSDNAKEFVIGILEELMLWYRDLIWQKTGSDKQGLFFPRHERELANQAKTISLPDLQARLEWLLEACFLVRRNLYQELVLVSTFIKLAGLAPAQQGSTERMD